MKKVLLAGVALNLVFAGAASAEIVLGVAGPITGQYATFGEQFRVGAEQAIADINAAGGVNGEQIVLSIGDDACDPRQAVAVANQFASEGVAAVIGHFCSGSSIPASQVYAEEGIVQISPASTNPAYTDERPGEGVYRVCGRDDQQGAVAGAYILENFADANVAVLDDRSAYGQGLAQETLEALQAGGKEPKVVESYTAGERDYTALVTLLNEQDIDLVYIGGYHTEAGLIARQMQEQGMDAIIMSGDALVSDEYWAITGDAGEGTLMTFSPDPRKNEAAAPVVEEIEAAGNSAEGYTLYTYAAIQAWAQAAEEAGSSEYDALVSALDEGTFDTVIGELEFDDKGDVTLPGYVVYEWSDGAYDYVDVAANTDMTEEGGDQLQPGMGVDPAGTEGGEPAAADAPASTEAPAAAEEPAEGAAEEAPAEGTTN